MPTSVSRSETNVPEEETKLDIIPANSSTPSSFIDVVSFIEPVFAVLRVESADRKETNDPLVCKMVLFERSSTIVAFTFGFAESLAIVSDTLLGTAPYQAVRINCEVYGSYLPSKHPWMA